MVKSVSGVNHRALLDWLSQRVSAIMMAAYFFGLIIFFIKTPGLPYYEWHGLFGHAWMKIITLLVVLSLLYHAWVGMWTVYTDYIKIFWLNWIIQIITILVLLALFFQTVLILWSV